MSQIGDIREAMATALAAIPGAQTTAYVVSNFSLPCAMVVRGDVDYDQAMAGGVTRWDLNVRVYVAGVTDKGSAMLLDEFLSTDGDSSVKAALEADTTLGGLISDLHVTGANGEQVYLRESGGPLLGSEFSVEIWL